MSISVQQNLGCCQSVSLVQSLGRVRLCDPMNHSTPGLPVHHQLPEFTQTRVHQVSDAIQPLILCRPLLLLPPIPPSIRVFSNESTLHMRWSEYWSFSFSISPSKEYPGLRKWQKSPLFVGIKGNVFVFYYCCNKLSVTQELKTIQMYYLTVCPKSDTGLTRLKSEYWQGCMSSGSSRENACLCLPWFMTPFFHHENLQ